MTTIKKIWEHIIEVHQATKKLSILAEEHHKDFKTFIQPIKEIKDAHDHVMRAEAVEKEYNIGIENPEEYIEKNLDKALGHEYRAFFDTADWFSIQLRQKITNILSSYTSDTIHKTIPDYYSNKKVFIEKVSDEIALLRGKKDIGNKNEIRPSVSKYTNKVENLQKIYVEIFKKIPQLDELKIEKELKEKRNNNKFIWGIIIGVVSTIIFGAIGIIITMSLQ